MDDDIDSTIQDDDMEDMDNPEANDNDNEDQDGLENNATENIIVIQPGSLHLRIGRASDPQPITIPHCMAWKTKSGSTNIGSWMARTETEHGDFTSMLFGGARIALEQLAALSVSRGKRRHASSTRELSAYNQTMKGEKTEILSPLTWTDLETGEDNSEDNFFIGDEALYLDPVNSGYYLVWPMSRGDLNIRSKPNYTATSLLISIEKLWTEAIKTHLNIQPADFKNYRCILLIPDRFNRSFVCKMVEILLEKLEFLSIQLVQESVCASFGAGVSSACVVDVGDQKTSVSCVEDGLSLPQSRITIGYGGRDITRIFARLIKNISFPYKSCKPDRYVLDALLMAELKHSYCSMDTDTGVSSASVQDIHFQTRNPGQPIVKYTMKIGDEAIIPTLAVFYPNMFGIVKQGRPIAVTSSDQSSLHFDIYDSDYIFQTRSKQEETAKNMSRKKQEAQEAGEDIDTQRDEENELIVDEDPVRSSSVNKKQTSNVQPENSELDISDDQLLPLDQAIIASIDKCSSEEMKCRMYSCVLVVGGGLMFDGVQELLQYRLWLNLQSINHPEANNISVITKNKDIDPQFISWKGGCILALLTSNDDYWISKDEWLKSRTKVIRDKSPFQW